MFKELGPELTLVQPFLFVKHKKNLSRILKHHTLFLGAFVIVGDGIDDFWLPIQKPSKKR